MHNMSCSEIYFNTRQNGLSSPYIKFFQRFFALFMALLDVIPFIPVISHSDLMPQGIGHHGLSSSQKSVDMRVIC
jgi:hypothetical protein